MRSSWLLAVLIVTIGKTLAQSTSEPADLQAYLDDIRKSAMSEDAKHSIYSVASFTTGATIIEFRKDESSGQYWPSYQSTVCPLPKADQTALAKWKEGVREKADTEIQRLRVLADSDSSGFVSSEEGSHFRFLVEFTIAFAQIADHEHNDVSRVCKGLGLTEEQLNKKKTEYGNLMKRAKTLGIESLPQIN